MPVREGVIYRATSPSGKCYIGQTVETLKRRRYLHERSANKQNSSTYNTRFAAAIRKYGDRLVWEVIHQGIPVDDLNDLEEKEISLHGSFKKGYNSIPTAFGGGMLGKHHTEEVKKKLSEQRSGMGNPMYGKSGELNPFYGKKHSTDTKLKWKRADMKGDKNPMYGKQSAMFGKKHTEKAKSKLSQQRLGSDNPFFGKRHSEETKQKMRESHRLRKLNADHNAT